MEAIGPEGINTEKNRDEKGRRIYDEGFKRKAVEGWEKSGLTQKAYARREGILYSTFVWWLQCFRRPTTPTKPAVRFAELTRSVFPAPQYVEAVLTDGTVLRGRTSAELVELIKLLRRVTHARLSCSSQNLRCDPTSGYEETI